MHSQSFAEASRGASRWFISTFAALFTPAAKATQDLAADVAPVQGETLPPLKHLLGANMKGRSRGETLHFPQNFRLHLHQKRWAVLRLLVFCFFLALFKLLVTIPPEFKFDGNLKPVT